MTFLTRKKPNCFERKKDALLWSSSSILTIPYTCGIAHLFCLISIQGIVYRVGNTKDTKGKSNSTE